jgi:hypothetical protein
MTHGHREKILKTKFTINNLEIGCNDQGLNASLRQV